MKKMLWKDIFKSIARSKGRFFSIMGLMMIGSFALVGLQVTGPDMRATGIHYFNQLNVADLTVIGSLGIDDNDVATINAASKAGTVEYGYLKDAVIKDTKTSIRIFSKGDTISKYEVVKGKMPEKANEIALDKTLASKYKLGDTISFSENADVSGKKIIKPKSFKIVGFVYSGEILSNVNAGISTAGTGSLNGYAVVPKSAFDSDFYMVARLRFKNLEHVSPYSKNYTALLQKHKESLSVALKNQPDLRLTTLKEDYQGKIDDGQDQIDSGQQELTDTQIKLAEAKINLAKGPLEIKQAQDELATKVAEATTKINNGASQLKSAKMTFASGQVQLLLGQQLLVNSEKTLADKAGELKAGKTQLQFADNKLKESNAKLVSAQKVLDSGTTQLATAKSKVAKNQAQLSDASSKIAAAEKEFADQEKIFDEKKVAYQTSREKFNQQKQTYTTNVSQLALAQREVADKLSELETAKQSHTNKIKVLEETQAALTAAHDNPNLSDAEKTELESQLKKAGQDLDLGNSAYATFLQETYEPGRVEIAATQKTLAQKEIALNQVKKILDMMDNKLQVAKVELDAGAEKLAAGKAELTKKKQKFADSVAKFQAVQKAIAQKENLLAAKTQEFNAGRAAYNAGLKAFKEKSAAYAAGLSAWEAGKNTFTSKMVEYRTSATALKTAQSTLQKKETELAQAKVTLASQTNDAQQKIVAAQTTLFNKQKEYNDKNAEFLAKKADAEKEISDKQKEVDKAQETIDNLSLPTYALNSRREIPGGEGNRIYSTIAQIVDSLAKVFPIFLYFVAALVTISTMARFVDEERVKSGTLKALGYENRDIVKKFTFYGLTSSLSGTFLGVALGHTLLPLIVNGAYQVGFTLPKIELHFYWGITVIALILALLSSILPAFVVAIRELQEKPAQLLLPKSPSAGSKIFLEHLTPIWNRMSFTHKVTARNIFRYKQRMLMTIFGVAGAGTLLFAGFSVQHSIGGINDRQFGDLIHYDMIVAKNNFVSDSQKSDIDALLSSDKIDKNKSIYYEELTKVAGKNKDTQEIKLIVPQTNRNFSDYMSLVNRKSDEKLQLPDDGVIISERLAKLLNVSVGEVITLKDRNSATVKMKVSGINEMYMGHFVFTSKAGYEKIFNSSYQSNAVLVNLKNSSAENTKTQAAKFMKLAGVAGVVQNTTLTNQINTIVDALNKIMTVLIIVAALLGIVILYNLTNINVSERMRELSTIKVLGFFDKEVTMYIYRETIILTTLGIITGFGLGELLHEYILNVVPPDDVMFNPSLSAISFLVPTVIISAVTLVLAFVINNRLKKVDMLEALKSVD